MPTVSMLNSTVNEISPAEYAAKIINQTNRHIFLTGKAGTGKTTFLRKIIQETHKKTIVVAPTGIAAINAGGVTLHSQFQLPFGAFVPSREVQVMNYALKLNNPDTLIQHMQMNGSKRQLLRELELLIIDEVSMLRADLLDAVDHVLRFVRRDRAPFGGVQVLFIGDLLQLPPVVKDEEWQLLQRFYKTILFFDAQALRNDPPLYIELDKIYRQNDPVFINLLNNLRNNELEQQDIDLLNQYYKPDLEKDKIKNTILLTTHNYKADAVNKAALEDLPTARFAYEATISGEFNEYSYPADKLLELKAGAQIMFIKNDPTGEQKFFNGKIAIVKSISRDNIMVEFADSKVTLNLEQYEWKNIKYELNPATGEIEEKIIGSFTQFPVKLAWAITVHKSQGLTFEKAILDINKAFAPGQIYVALSRLKSLDGLILTEPIRHLRLGQNEDVLEFGNTKKPINELEGILEEERDAFAKNYLIKRFNFSVLIESLTEHAASYKEDITHSNKKKHHEWALQLLQDTLPYREQADKFLVQIRKIVDERKENYLQFLSARIEAACNYFTPALKELSKRLTDQMEIVKKDKKVKTYLKELEELEKKYSAALREMSRSVGFISSLVNKREFTKSDVNQILKQNELVNQGSEMTEVEELSIKNRGKKGKGKTDKLNSKLASLELFKQGMSILEIAKTRDFAVTTIEGHLAHYVGTGEIDIKSLMSEEKAIHIIDIAERIGNPLLGVLKQELGEEYSYSELKFANAYKKFLKGEGVESGE